MSFAYKVKKELSELPLESYNAIFYELYAIVLFNNSSSDDKIIISNQNELLFGRVIKLAQALQKSPTVKINFKIIENKILIDSPALKQAVNFSKIPDIYAGIFLRGVFLTCASMVNPETEYHLEFSATTEILNLYLFNAFKLVKFDFNPNVITRRGNTVLYIKESEKIIDFLVFIGAQQSAMELMQIKMVKEMRNNINRSTNCETANIAKTAVSATKQIEAIKLIKKQKKFELTPELQETADLRLAHPYASLNELAQMHKPHITKSGLNHRLKKLISIAECL